MSGGPFQAQHDRLAALLEILALHKGKTSETEEVRFDIEAFINYAEFHFREEELAMKQASFPGYDKHRKEHERLLGELHGFYTEFMLSIAVVSDEFLARLRGWLLDHTNTMDRDYEPYLTSP